MSNKNPWRGLQKNAAETLSTRNYGGGSLAERLATVGVEAGEIVAADRTDLHWIPGVEVFSRTIYPQRHRGSFGELARGGEGTLGEIKLWPRQWAAARMFANSAKGFHVHPPFVPEGKDAAQWLRDCFADGKSVSYDYEREQWDVMFFVQGRVELILRDLRAGFPGRTMRLFV